MLRYSQKFARVEVKDNNYLRYIAVRHPDDKGLSRDISEYIFNKLKPILERLIKKINKLKDKVEEMVLERYPLDRNEALEQRLLKIKVKSDSMLEKILPRQIETYLSKINLPTISIGDFIHEEPDFLANPKAQEYLANVDIRFGDLGHENAEGIIYDGNDIVIDIRYFIENYDYIDREVMSSMKEHIRTIVAHELNHAIAESYRQALGRDKEHSPETQEAFDKNPMLDKDERIAYAYNVASLAINHINRLYGLDYAVNVDETELMLILQRAYAANYGWKFPSERARRDFFRRSLMLAKQRLNTSDYSPMSHNLEQVDERIAPVEHESQEYHSD